LKILIDNNHSFAYAHGGIQNFIENSIEHLNLIGVEAETLRWWDVSQKGDLIHFFYRPSEEYLRILKGKKKIVTNVLLGPLSSMNIYQRQLRKYMYWIITNYMNGFSNDLSLNIGQYSDAVIYHSEIEKKIGMELLQIPLEKSFVILPGVEEEYYSYYNKKNSDRKNYLITLSTIYEVKNSVYLAKLARFTKIPIIFLGKPFNENSKYYREFLSLVDDQYVIYLGDPSTEEKAKLMFDAKGFILLSKYESGPNVVNEASACGCPLILSDLGWAKSNYFGYASFVSIGDMNLASKQLVEIYRNIKTQKIFPVKNWHEIAIQLKRVYEFAINS
jgi:glycosyltransferase involved in cell wall biosynthesis